ncbi:L-lactate permease [Actinomyces bovis]|uniref:L-lactate permease n=1 Tax=Actinomyces bovis TaxID=1658 RepID=A0ABY1VLV9_9ACTO|nr:L-lactate permease [Actinomyces bovis]SPT53000.1 L-lactate permease [Actinomyces bovis]VEG55239.1 L-lactate permease [Actinomyces israelii]
MTLAALSGLHQALPSATFTPSTTSVGGNVFATAAVGLLPLVVFFVLMGAFKVKTHWCAIISFALSALIAIFAFKMPAGMTIMSGTQGLALGFVPIIYIIIAAVWLYNLTETSGRSQDLKAVFNTIGKGDQRAQALIVAFSFCGLMEGLAGFGAPVAITCAMLVALGLPPVKAAIVTIVGNAINVGFGAIAIPTTTAGKLGGQDPTLVAQNMGHISWIIATFIPLILLFILDGSRGIKQLWPLALVSGFATAAGHFFIPEISYELTAVVASLLGLAACYVFLLVWTPTTPEEYRTEVAAEDKPNGQRVALALLPYVLVVVIIAITKLFKSLSKALSATDIKIKWPGVYGDLLNAKGEPSGSAIYNLQILSNPGTWIFVTAIIVAIVYGLNSSGGRYQTSVGKMFAVLPKTIYNLRLAILTISMVMALAYVMNFSGQTTSIGAALATTGAAFGFLSPMLGYVGTAVAGSATSAGALFANLQATAAAGAGLDPQILLAANTIGGGIGKIVSPQNLAIAATAVNAPGTDAEILKKAAPYSIGLLLVLCTLVFIASQGWLGSYMP